MANKSDHFGAFEDCQGRVVLEEIKKLGYKSRICEVGIELLK
jgi:hypothetical protein